MTPKRKRIKSAAKRLAANLFTSRTGKVGYLMLTNRETPIDDHGSYCEVVVADMIEDALANFCKRESLRKLP